MDKTYWLNRKKASLKLAANAAGSRARLVHYDLAGRYSLKAISAEATENELADLPSASIIADCVSESAKDMDDA